MAPKMSSVVQKYLLYPERLDGGVVEGAVRALRRQLRQHRLLVQQRRQRRVRE